MSLIIPFSDACERNKDPIASVLQPYFLQVNNVLEIGSGTGQHAIHFAALFPNLSWQTSDQQSYIEGISAQLQNAGVHNAQPPLLIEVSQQPWLESKQCFDAVYTANTLHIMNWSEVEAFFSGLPAVINYGAYLMIYGPFKIAGEFTSASNAAFDRSLRAGGQAYGQAYKEGSAIRDFEQIDVLAQSIGFNLLKNQAMPANNQCLVWQYKSKSN